jgi:hypothetical protein
MHRWFPVVEFFFFFLFSSSLTITILYSFPGNIQCHRLEKTTPILHEERRKEEEGKSSPSCVSREKK